MSFNNISKNANYIYFKWQLKSKIILTNTICSSDRKVYDHINNHRL